LIACCWPPAPPQYSHPIHGSIAVGHIWPCGQRCRRRQTCILGVRFSGTYSHNPASAASAAAVDYLAGQLSSSPRWLSISPLIKQQMLQTRTEVRKVLGIVSDASSHAAVNSLLEFADAWQVGNQSAAVQALGPPVFTLLPTQTQQVLSNMPPMSSGNTATMTPRLPCEAAVCTLTLMRTAE
jgi:hypothetical protein